MAVKEAKKQCRIEVYDPHSNAGYVIIDDNDHVVNNFHGHPIVYKNQSDAQSAINEYTAINEYNP